MEDFEAEAQQPLFHDNENITQIRDITHDSNFQMETINPFQNNEDTSIHLEASIKDAQNQYLERRGHSDSLAHRTSIMLEMPEVLRKSLDISRKTLYDLPGDQDKAANGEREEDNLIEMEIMDQEKWSLSDIETIQPKRKKRKKPLTIDKNTVIPNYAARALHLSKNIDIRRVQVYEGPPSILQSMSLSHIMTNPSFRASPQAQRNSKLNLLYQRHLVTDKKLFQPHPSHGRQFMDIRQAKQILEPQKSFEEEVGVPMKTSQMPHAKETLAEISAESSLQEECDLDFASVGMDLEKESYIGQPLSRIAQPIIPSPDTEHINTDVPFPNGRVQQLQGQRVTSPAGVWTYTAEKSPPNEKWREFNFVMNKIEESWALSEQRNQSKEINAITLLSFEEDNVASFLTLLRILDKLSLQRKLALKVNKGNIFIRPFEKPYVSDKALMLKDKEPKF